MKSNNFKETLKKEIDKFVHPVYRLTKNFPKEELYNAAPQLRRSVLSVALNYIEGFARRNGNFIIVPYKNRNIF